MNSLYFNIKQKTQLFFTAVLKSCLFASSFSLLSAPYLQEEPLNIAQYFSTQPFTEERASGVEGIDAIYVINLDIRPDKYRDCLRKFAANEIFVHRFAGINGWELQFKTEDFFKNYKIIMTDAWPHAQHPPLWTRGEIGCALSHLSIIQDAYNRGLETIWIIEDDVRFVTNPQVLSPILKRLTALDPGWDVYYTDPHGIYEFKHGDNLHVRPERWDSIWDTLTPKKWIEHDIQTAGLRFGNYSYILSRSGMEKILFHFTHAPWYKPFDVEIHLVEHIREYSCPHRIVTIGSLEVSDTWRRPGL